MTAKRTAKYIPTAPLESLKPKELILVVDDEKSQRELLSAVLGSVYEVFAVPSVAQALIKAEHTPPALVIMDYSMPGESGIEGLRRLREIYPNLPIMMLTGHADLDVAKTAFSMGAVEYMLKPFEPTDLMSVIARSILKSRSRTEAPAAPLAEVPYSMQRRMAANVDLWRSRLPTVPSENRLSAVLSSGRSIEAKVLRLNRNSVQAEVYDPAFWMESGQVVSSLQVWLGGEQAYSGVGSLGGIITTGPSSICEFSLEGDWTLAPASASASSPSDKITCGAQEFVARWRDKDQIKPAFKLAISEIAALLMELRDWLGGIENSVRIQGGASEDYDRATVEQLFQEISPSLTTAFRAFEEEAKSVPDALIGLYAEHVRTILHPLVLCAPFVHRSFTKPLYYPGDYEVMNYMLGDPFQGNSLFARIFNAWVVRSGACATYRFRVDYLEERLREESKRVVTELGRPCRVLSLGCGAAPEVQRFIMNERLSSETSFTLLDFSADTLKYTRERISAAKAISNRDVATHIQEFSVQQMLAQGTRLISNPSLDQSGILQRGHYDLVYCAGLFDYLSDRICERLLNIFWELAAPGAAVVATNFAPPNPMRAFMDYVLDWRLLHRDEPLVRSLAVKDDSCPSHRTDLSPGGVEIFLRMRREQVGKGANAKFLSGDRVTSNHNHAVFA